MDSETVESASHPAPTSAAATASQPDADRPVALEQAGPDAWGLVARMTEAGEWPEPELLEQILAAGDAATLPLIDVLHSRPRGWPAEGLLYPVIGLLRMLRPRAAIPELIEILKCYKNETAEAAADALVDFGTPGFDALVELCNDPSIQGYARNFVFEASVYAAGDDRAQRSRLAEVLRPILEERIARAREELEQKGWLAKLPPRAEFLDDEEDEDEDEDEDQDHDEYDDVDEDEDEDGEFKVFDAPDDDEIDQEFLDEDEDEDEDEDLGAVFSEEEFRCRADDSETDDSDEGDHGIKPEVAEELAYVVGALADLADPLASDAIMTAFREGLVDEAIIDQAEVDVNYSGFAVPADAEPVSDWLSAYRDDYEAHLDELTPSPRPPRIFVPRPTYQGEDLEPDR